MKQIANLCMLVFVAASCRAVEGGLIGGGAGFAVTKTAEGTGVGFLAGFLVGAWDDVTAWVANFWHGLFGAPAPKPPEPHTMLLVSVILGGLVLLYLISTHPHIRKFVFWLATQLFALGSLLALGLWNAGKTVYLKLRRKP